MVSRQLRKHLENIYNCQKSCVLQLCPLYNFPHDLDALIPVSSQEIVFQEFVVKLYLVTTSPHR